MHIPDHTQLSGYIDVAQTILLMSTIAGLFPDRPYISLLVDAIYQNDFNNGYVKISTYYSIKITVFILFNS